VFPWSDIVQKPRLQTSKRVCCAPCAMTYTRQSLAAFNSDSA